MTIFFFGQRGIPAHRDAGSINEQRTERLAYSLAATGHTAIIPYTKAYSQFMPRQATGILPLRHLSLSSATPSGGWAFLLLSIISIWRIKPQAIHVHTWKAAILSPLVAFVSPESTLVWTISTLPHDTQWQHRLTAWFARYAFDSIVSPSRHIQYRLLTRYGIKATYIPDGYVQPAIPRASLAAHNVRKGQYCVTTAEKPDDITWIAQAYALARTRKKLIVLSSRKTPALARLKKRFPFLVIVESLPGRGYASWLSQAALVIAAHSQDSPEMLLHAMDSSRPVIAITEPMHEETLGTTARFVTRGDVAHLKTLLDVLATNQKEQRLLGQKAAKRAQNHFRWERSFEEYYRLYRYPVVTRVPLDSARPMPAQQVA